MCSITNRCSVSRWSAERDLGRRVDHAAHPWNDVEDALLGAELDVLLEPRRAVGSSHQAVPRRRERAREHHRRLCRIRPVGPRELDDATGAVGVVERELPREARTHDDTVVVYRPRHGLQIQEAPEQDLPAPRPRRPPGPRPVRRRVDQRLASRLEHLTRRGADVESWDLHGIPPPAEEPLPQLLPQRPSPLDLTAAVDALVAARECLGDRRRRPQGVDHDRDRRLEHLVRREGHMGAHPRTTLPRPPMAEPMYCYRHPDRETMVSCSECERPIYPDGMVFARVGIRCPQHAGQAQGAARVTQSVRRAGYEGTGAIVTKILVAMNVGIYLLELAAGGDINGTGNRIFTEGALYGPAVAAGDWWRLFTAPFLHYGPIHLAFNMLALWWFGSAVEATVGRGRYL